MKAAEGFDRSTGEAGEGADGAAGDREQPRRGAGRAETATLFGGEGETFREGTEACGAVEEVRGVARVEEEADFQQQARFRGGAGAGEMIEIGREEGENFGVAVTAAEGFDEFAAVGGKGKALQVDAQADAEIDQFGVAQAEKFSPLGGAVVKADRGERFEGRAEAFAAGASVAGETFADPVLRGEEGDDAVTLAVIAVMKDDGVAGVQVHGEFPCCRGDSNPPRPPLSKGGANRFKELFLSLFDKGG